MFRFTLFFVAVALWGVGVAQPSLPSSLLLPSSSSENSPSVVGCIYFERGQSSIEQGYDLSMLVERIDRLSLDSTSRVWIVGWSSPEGSTSANFLLAWERGEALRDYLCSVVGTPRHLISLSARVATSDDVEAIIERQFASQSPPSGYIVENIYPLLRRAEVSSYTPYVPSASVPVSPPSSPVVSSEDQVVVVEDQPSARPLFALKTNLLFDLATLVNIELELPIGSRYSLALEYIFPWWRWDDGSESSERDRTQLLSLTAEGRYWFGDPTQRLPLTGWFGGLYGSYASYDFERNGEGYQGETLLSVGLSGGYAHTINREGTLRLEYSLGVGYLSTNYIFYHAEYCNNSYWHAVEQRSGRFWWVGITRARVSLAWLIGGKSKGRR